MLAGLIFDLDGVIADTARFHLAAWQRLATSLNIILPEAVVQDLRGRSRQSSLDLILSYGDQGYSPQEKAAMAQQKNVWYQAAIQRLTPQDILPGISELLAQADKRHLPLALASASQNAPQILQQLHLSQRFAAIVDPSSLQHGKPDPEIFIKAQQLLGLTKDAVISFEDAAAGVEAIQAAGQFAVGIGPSAKRADYWVPDTQALHLDEIEAAYTKRR